MIWDNLLTSIIYCSSWDGYHDLTTTLTRLLTPYLLKILQMFDLQRCISILVFVKPNLKNLWYAVSSTASTESLNFNKINTQRRLQAKVWCVGNTYIAWWYPAYSSLRSAAEAAIWLSSDAERYRASAQIIECYVVLQLITPWFNSTVHTFSSRELV